EEHELARSHREAGLLEEREQRALGVDLVDELAGGADGGLVQRRVLLDGGPEVDVLLPPGEVEDVGQLLLALVDPADEAHAEEGEAAADEDHGGQLPAHWSRSRSATSRALGT